MFRLLVLFCVILISIHNIAGQFVHPEGLAAQKTQKVITQKIYSIPQSQNPKQASRTQIKTNTYVLRSRRPMRVNKRQQGDDIYKQAAVKNLVLAPNLNKKETPVQLPILNLAPNNAIVNEKVPGGLKIKFV